jgi:hypothetical protein
MNENLHDMTPKEMLLDISVLLRNNEKERTGT